MLRSFEQISKKFLGNIWLIFLQFGKFSVIRVLAYYDWKEIKNFLQGYLKEPMYFWQFSEIR